MRGRLDGKSLSDYDSQGYKTVLGLRGPDFFKKDGVPLDLLADELVRSGLLPEGSGANELLVALQAGGKRYFQAAMYPSKASSTAEFVAEANALKPGDKKMFYHLGKISRPDGIIKNASIELGSDQARHISNEHPNFGDWDGIADAILAGEPTRLQKNKVTGKDTYAFTLDEGRNAFIVIASPVDGKKGRRVVVLTAFKDSQIAVENWLKEQKKGTAFFQSAEEITAYPNPDGVNPSDRKSGTFNNNIATDMKDVNDSEENTYYHNRGANARGFIDLNNPQAMIYLFKGKYNLSTVLHEGSHFFLNNLAEAAQLENSPQWVKDAWRTLQEKYGFEGYEVPTEIHEEFARTGEAYFRGGKAPSMHLKNAFQQFRYWLTRIYRSIRRLLGAEQLDPEIRDIFDRLLASEEELQALRRSPDSAKPMPEVMEGASEDLRTRHRQAVEEAQARAEEKALTRRLVEQRRMEKILREAALEELKEDAFYRTEEESRQAPPAPGAALLPCRRKLATRQQ